MFVHSFKQVAAWNLKNGQYFNIDRNRSLVLDMMISLQLKQTQSTIISAVIANVVGCYHTYTSNLMHWEFTALVKSFCTGSTSSRQLKSVWRSLILVCVHLNLAAGLCFWSWVSQEFQKNATRRLNSWRVCEFSLSGTFWLLDQICDQVFRICLQYWKG